MDDNLRIGFIGFSNSAKAFRNAIDKCDNLSFEGTFFTQNNEFINIYDEQKFEDYQQLLDAVDIVCFFGDKIPRKIISDTIKALKHILVVDYHSILNDNINSFCRLAEEAGIVAQIAMPKIYYWSIAEVMSSYKNIRYINFDKVSDYDDQRPMIDIYPEIIAILKLADSEITSVHSQKLALIARKTELLQISFEFLNGVNASIKANPCGFYDSHELNIIAEKNLAMIDLRKREWHNLVYKTSTAMPTKEMFTLDEVPFIEREELNSMVNSIQQKTEPFISFKTMRSLWKCIELINNQ